jgi:hypothetical protein
MPEPLGGANRLVDSVIHTIDSNGWITEITTGGEPDLSNMPEVSTTLTPPATIVSGNPDETEEDGTEPADDEDEGDDGGA